ncbi:MAG: Aldehyde dehydrogenase [Labilithrix sp.]|nr:Aldehyde dehydrogenase [Labilithrix sp.]
MDIRKELAALGLDPKDFEHGDLVARSPIDGSVTAKIVAHDAAAVDAAIGRAHTAFLAWRSVPAPRRGELIRLFGEELRKEKDALASIVTIEAGKIVPEARGEVQEMIDICDFACGLSRQLYGLTIASERPGHRMSETWHPLGVVGVISAFNFPVAVWAWNFALAVVCGNSVVWKPSEKTPLTAAACHSLFLRACKRFAEGGAAAPEGLSEVLQGTAAVGERLVDDRRVALVSATGSTRMGRAVAPRVAARFGRTLLELGGNNAMIVAPTADLELATRAVLFSAAGTAGQRCTTLRRLIAHESIRTELASRVERAYAQIRVGDPREAATLVGPLIDLAPTAASTFAQRSCACRRRRTS